MKKWKHMLLLAMLTMLTACSADFEHEESSEQSGIEMPESEEMAEEPGSGAEAPEKETGIEESGPGTEEGEESTAFPERIYEADIIYYNEASDGVHLRKDVEKTRTDYAVYYFEIPISAQERNACIAATDRVLSCVDARLPDIGVVVLQQKSYDGISISGNRLYLSPQSWDSVDYLAKVLLAGYGEWANYGIAYGYADYLCKKACADSGESEPDVRKAGSFKPVSVPELYDMTLLCFDEKFASTEDVEAAKANAYLFVEDYLSSHSEDELLELLAASGTVEGVGQAGEALEKFYAENGVDCSLTEIRYQPGGALAEYAAACGYACFYVYKDWQDRYWDETPGVSENFLHEDYGAVRAFFECNAWQMQQYQELFGFDSYSNDFSVLLKNYPSSSAPSFCSASKRIIGLENVSSLMHEYIHSLMVGRNLESPWEVEGFASYFSMKYNFYLYDLLNSRWNHAADSTKYIQEYIDTVGRPIDVRTDFRELDDILAHLDNEPDPNTSYQSGSSFIGYLIEQYGEQAVIAYVCSDDEYNAEWDKSYEELVRDWRNYIRKNYSQYSTVQMR